MVVRSSELPKETALVKKHANNYIGRSSQMTVISKSVRCNLSYRSGSLQNEPGSMAESRQRCPPSSLRLREANGMVAKIVNSVIATKEDVT